MTDESDRRSVTLLRTPAAPTAAPRRASGVLDAASTGFQASLNTRTWKKQAEEYRAQNEFHTAQGDAIKSWLRTRQIAAELYDLPEIIDHDRQVRAAQRAKELATAQRLALEAGNWLGYVERTGLKNIDIREAQKDASLAEWRAVQEPVPTAASNLLAEIDRLLDTIQEKRAQGIDVSHDLQDLAELQAIHKRRGGGET